MFSAFVPHTIIHAICVEVSDLVTIIFDLLSIHTGYSDQEVQSCFFVILCLFTVESRAHTRQRDEWL